MTEVIKIGISTCLLGESVRYDGGHKLDRYLRDTLGQFVRYVPVCPEVECGLPTPREAMRLVAQTEGILLDPVYTGRAMAGLIDLVRQEVYRPDENIVFWHTGGIPALFAYRDKLM